MEVSTIVMRAMQRMIKSRMHPVPLPPRRGDRGESSRQSRLKLDLSSVDGMLESQKLGVHQIASIAGQAREIFKRLAACAVQRVAHQGLPAEK